jgi:hypothetical protein
MSMLLILLIYIPDNMAFSQSNRFLVGWASADITPDRPVALVGQLHKRISVSVQDPITATVLAVESNGENGSKEQAIMISCDLLRIRALTQKKLQESIAGKLTDFDASKLFLNATHSHTAPGLVDNEYGDLYDTSDDKGVMIPSEYERFFIERISEAVIKAWKERQPGGFSWGLGNAFLSHNRRTVKTDGSGKMYGVGDANFSHYESIDNHQVEMLFFWNKNQELKGMVINSTATAQVTDGTNFISADFYNEVRENFRKKYGKDIFIMFQVGAAGDMTPSNHEYIYRRAEETMLKLKGITARQEMADRMLKAVDEVMPFARMNISDGVIFRHTVVRLELPVSRSDGMPFYRTDDVNPAEIHIIRLGDIAIATNPFELFLDYGLMIKARSKAVLTLIVQLACQHSGYLPTERAVKSGGYSADKYLVGTEGGYKLVEETVKHINELWE